LKLSKVLTKHLTREQIMRPRIKLKTAKKTPLSIIITFINNQYF